MAGTPYHGKTGTVYMSTVGSGTAAAVVGLSHWTLNASTDKVPVTAFGDTNKIYVQGLKDIQGTLSGFFDSATDTLFDASESADPVKMYLYPASGAPTIYWYGTAWVDASIDVDVNGAVGISGSFVAATSWGRKP